MSCTMPAALVALQQAAPRLTDLNLSSCNSICDTVRPTCVQCAWLCRLHACTYGRSSNVVGAVVAALAALLAPMTGPLKGGDAAAALLGLKSHAC